MSILVGNGIVPETIEVQVLDAWVTLTGEVEWQYQKEEAERALCALRAIKGIRNEIRIRATAHVGDVSRASQLPDCAQFQD